MRVNKWKDEHKDEQLKYQREWYSRNKEKQKRIVRDRQAELEKWYKEYKATLHCDRCPETHPATFDFHHLDSSKKDANIGDAIHSGWSKKRIFAEISKCIVLCANCHRKLHWNE